ncbi:hypothetical protein [Glaciimonas immobilis]|uniref:Uncharacterized protein n=1 Tax=Glaciimonas immobilis TaxID=728004 RepID=A0A840RMW3_9BURK|nr:hypothetical protein [Glaciimonas immobilis]KAF3998183.1 hypothetical protein HAV38_11645 [Glaciimonas immobilis]MBB5199103.1 hypothetical protein [Glaciimonas immobilis]
MIAASTVLRQRRDDGFSAVQFIGEAVGDAVGEAIGEVRNGHVILKENEKCYFHNHIGLL